MFGITRRKGAAIQLKLDPAYVFWSLVKNSPNARGEKLKENIFFFPCPLLQVTINAMAART